MIPNRRKPQRIGLRHSPLIRSDSHLRWVRGFECCCAASGNCEGRIEAAHVRSETDGGMGVKPSDRYAVPLCSGHHAEQHRLGEGPFEALYKISMRKIADALWAKSPHRAAAEAG